MRVIVVDDEPLAREGVTVRLAQHPDFAVIGEGASGEDALSLINTRQPDLVFLDIQMGDMSGIEVLRQLGGDKVPLVIFLTAFDEYAVAAFQVQALDYLLKPLDEERFELALQRARRQFALKGRDNHRSRIHELLQMYGEDAGSKPPKRFAVRCGAEVSFVQVSDIDWIEGNGDYANLHVGKRTHLLREPLQSLAQRLSTEDFVRVHRSAIIQLDRIRTITPLPNRDCELTLVDGTQLRSSRTYSKELWTVLKRLGL